MQSLRTSIVRVGTLAKSIQRRPFFRNRSDFQPTMIRNRQYSSESRGKGVRSRLGMGVCTAIAAAGVGGGYYLWTTQGGSLEAQNETKYCPKYQRVYNAIAESLNDDDYDDGSYGPILVRLAWHSSGTYDMKSNTGGSNKATMRFEPESKYDANKGLHVARKKLETIKNQFPWISYGDLWTLAGVCGVQEMGGPTIAWMPGRRDGTAADCPPDGRLPDGKQGNPQHPRDVFYRMGFNDQEIVALIGAHTLGRCHEDRSGFDGHWTTSPTTFSNSFFVDLLNRKWVERKWNGNKQFEDEESKELMMLPTDLTFLQDSSFNKWAQMYAKDEQKFFQDFAKAYQKLLELGVPYPKGRPEYIFKTLDEQSKS